MRLLIKYQRVLRKADRHPRYKYFVLLRSVCLSLETLPILAYTLARCRKRDVSQVTPLHHSPTLTPSIPSHSDSQPPDILPQRSPTVLRPVSFAFSDMSISELGSPIEELEGQIGRRDSEAARYLAQFRSSTWDGESSSTRRRNNRISTATDDSGLPSLIHSPSSSVGTVASAASIRPSLSRQNKSYSSCSGAPLSPTQAAKDASFKSSASTLTAFRVAEAGDFSYDKRSASRKGSEAQGSLKQLFSHEAMKAPPTQASQISQTD